MGLRYVPYTGPAGPSAQQIKDNTNALAKALKRRGLKVKRTQEYVSGWLDPHSVAWVQVGKKMVVYDRWGFVSHSDKLDQADWKTTLNYMLGKT